MSKSNSPTLPDQQYVISLDNYSTPQLNTTSVTLNVALGQPALHVVQRDGVLRLVSVWLDQVNLPMNGAPGQMTQL